MLQLKQKAKLGQKTKKQQDKKTIDKPERLRKHYYDNKI